nr:derlin-2.2 [Ipomoea batatas]
MAQAVEEWYKQMPVITRSYLTAAVVTTIGCSLEIISPYNLYLNPKLVVKHYEFWRLITNFLYFRKMDLDFLFHMFFLARYCKLLEENSFRGRTADFLYMLLFGATVLTGIVLIGGMIPYVSESFARIIFLSNSLTFMMVLLGFSVLVGASAWVDLLVYSSTNLKTVGFVLLYCSLSFDVVLKLHGSFWHKVNLVETPLPNASA